MWHSASGEAWNDSPQDITCGACCDSILWKAQLRTILLWDDAGFHVTTAYHDEQKSLVATASVTMTRGRQLDSQVIDVRMTEATKGQGDLAP
jgi:hypothetical protein